MDFIITQEDGVAVVKTNVERLNATNAPDLKGELVAINKNNINNIIIDLNKTKYCDSSGLSAVLVANRLCKDTNGRFVICGLQPNVLKMIQIAQLDRVLSIEDDLKKALETIRS